MAKGLHGINICTNVKRLVSIVYPILVKPFKVNIYMFFALLFLFASVDVLCATEGVFFRIGFFLNSFLLAYIFSYISLSIGNRILKFIYNSLLFASAIFMFVLDCYCAAVYHTRFNDSFAEIVLGTNYKEFYEYITFYFSPAAVVGIIIALASFVWATRYIKYLPAVNNKLFLRLLVVLLLLGGVSGVVNYRMWKNVFLGKLIFAEVEPIPDLRMYLSNPPLDIQCERLPQNVVVIIGESLSRHQCSLYGYEKVTNPNLARYIDTPNMVSYNKVVSVAIATISTFRSLLSMYGTGSYDSTEWHLCPTLPEVATILGYNTYWISNQSKSGFNDNLVTRYAELCDSMLFTNLENVGVYHHSYDEEVLSLIDDVQCNIASGENNFYFIHLMGSHYSFERRYPAEYNCFSSADYCNFPEWQRETRAHYDNSVLYNDYVVSEIISRFTSEETLLFYFPDHALDLYHGDDDYVGHGRAAVPLSEQYGREIPFIIYMSDKYIENFPAAAECITKHINRKFTTKYFMLSVMDILGVYFKDNNDAAKYSLFRER